MSFGQIMKKLRGDFHMTQERLAELLDISPQAVSRWETNAAMPDISLLPPIANLFGVTTDYLLGMDAYQKDLRRAEYDEAFQDYWKKDDKEKNYRIALRAAAEYPGDMAYQEWLASAEFYVAFLQKEDARYYELLDSSEKHYKIVLENAEDKELRRKARHGIVLDLYYSGRLEEAKAYALDEEDEKKRDELLFWCLKGEEKKRHGQKLAETKFNAFITQLTYGPQSIDNLCAVEKILEIVFPDGNYLYYNNTLQYSLLHKAELLCGHRKYDEAVAALRKARHCAEAMTEFRKETRYRFTSPLFGLLEGEQALSDLDETDLDDFYSYLKEKSCFDPLRDREDFRAL